MRRSPALALMFTFFMALISEVTLVEATTSTPTLDQAITPSAPPVSDPLLAPPPPAPRVLRSWSEALLLIRAQAPNYGTSEENVRRAEAQSAIALASIFPSASGQLSYTHQFFVEVFSFGTSAVVYPPQNVFTAGGTANWNLGNPRAFYALGTAKQNLEAVQQGFSDARRQLAVSLVNAMLGTLAAARVAELNRIGLRAALERLVLTQTKLRYRQGTALDVDRGEQDAASARTQLITGDESLRETREALGLAVGSKVAIAAPGDLDLEAFETAVAATCRMSDELENRSDVAAARSRLVVAERSIRDVWLTYTPSASLQLQASWVSEVPFGPKTTWTFQALLNVPLIDPSLFGSLRDSRAAAEQARQALAEARLQALVTIAQAQREVAVQTALRDVAEQQRNLAARIDQRTREGYTHGIGTSLDLVTSAQSLRQAEINYALLVFQVAQARAQAVLANAECVY